MRGDSALEAIMKRDRVVVLTGLAGATTVAWIYLGVAAVGMAEMPAAMAQMKPWGAADLSLMFLMWAVMMAGMMVPTAAPMILLFALVHRKSRADGGPFIPAGVFALGYVLVWTAFSLIAAALQWRLNAAALLSPMIVSTSAVLGGVLFLAAGAYEWTPLKHACLKHWRSPFQFIMHRRRAGTAGALRMGLEHGAYCLGCCWVLMGLLFVGGVMNLLWVAAISVFVLAEKAAPRGDWAARLSGAAMAAAGVFLLLSA